MRASLRTPARLASRIAIVAALVWLATPSWGGATSPTDASETHRVIAIPPFSVDGKLPAAALDRVQGELVEGVKRAGFEVIAPVEVGKAFGGTPCSTTSCVSELGAKTEATHVLQVSIDQDGRDYLVRMVLSRTSDGTALATFSHTCEICGVVELAELIANQSASLRDKLVVIPAKLFVKTTPAGATVSVDGEPLGTTPLQHTLRPGSHVVEIEKPGFHRRRRELTLVEGDEAMVDFELIEIEVPEQTQAETKRDLTKPFGWTSFGLGVATLGGAVVPFVLNGRPVKTRCEGENIDINGLCRYRYTTMLPGIVMATAGGALLVTGIALIAVHAKRKRNNEGKRARLMIGPTEIGMQMHF